VISCLAEHLIEADRRSLAAVSRDAGRCLVPQPRIVVNEIAYRDSQQRKEYREGRKNENISRTGPYMACKSFSTRCKEHEIWNTGELPLLKAFKGAILTRNRRNLANVGESHA
jgi:hypothetical protein